MPKPVDEDRARRRELLEQKRLARKAAKEKEDEQKRLETESNLKRDANTTKNESVDVSASNVDRTCWFVALPDDAIHVIYSMLSAADLGRVALTCKRLNIILSSARILYLLTRLSSCKNRSRMSACDTEEEIRMLLEDSLTAGGDTGRILPRGKFARQTSNEFVSYARFLEEAVCGYNYLFSSSSSKKKHRNELIYLPVHVQGRFVSCSPEHTVCRVGGDGSDSGAGGSGVATWGIGKRGQLGHGKRQDERYPKRILSTSSTDSVIHAQLGYGIRIVQVSAGGGLVRVAHTLLLTSTGRVMSFGTGQYGALGHGLSAAKQLPDVLKPSYINGPLSNVKCICVSAGELHSAVVTSDGDVFSFGDGFCGQLGHGDKRPQLSPKQITVGNLQDEVVVSISCGCRHTIAVTEDGDAYSFGLGHFGVLGRSFTPFEYDAQTAVNNFATDGDNDDAMAPPAAAVSATPQSIPLSQSTLTIPPGQVRDRDYASELSAHLDLIANLSLDDASDQCIPKVIDSLKGIRVVGASAGHRHSLILDNNGGLYSFGSGTGGCLGHGDTVTQMYPCRIQAFDDGNILIHQMSAGVDISMAVSTSGDVYSWGKTDAGRIGLGMSKNSVTLPRKLSIQSTNGIDSQKSHPIKAVDVECGYVHSLIVGLNGTLHLCGGVGVHGEDDGQKQLDDSQDFDESTNENQQLPLAATGRPTQIQDFNIWHRLPEPTEIVVREKWKKYGKYEVKGRAKMLSNED